MGNPMVLYNVLRILKSRSLPSSNNVDSVGIPHPTPNPSRCPFGPAGVFEEASSTIQLECLNDVGHSRLW